MTTRHKAEIIETKLSSAYYSPRGYWKGFAAVKKLAKASNVSENEAQSWLEKQALWQIYLPPPRDIPRPKFDISVPNEVHQADLLFLPHDRPGGGSGSFINMPSQGSMWRAGTKKPSLWLPRRPNGLPQLSLASTRENLCDGQSFSKSTPAQSLWVQ